MSESGGYHGYMEEVIEVIELIADPLNTANVFLSMLSVVINILHLLVLTRKSINSSSTNCIMIGIAISDIFTLLLTVEKYFTLVDIENNECISSNSLIKVYIDMLSWAIQDYFRRCSSWLGLSMATVRTLIVRRALKTSTSLLSKALFGRRLVSVIFVCASIPSTFYYFRFQVLENSRLSLPISCEEFQDIHRHPKYTLNLTQLFTNNDYLVLRGFLMLDAVLSKFIPCLCFPIFTILLIRALRKAKRSQKVPNAKQSEAKGSDHTTRLVILMTIAFFLAEAPLGIIYTIRAFYHDDDGLIIASVDVIIVFACLLTINSTCHFFFCLFLSRQYRSTVHRLLRLERFGCAPRMSKKSDSTRNASTIFGPPSVKLAAVY